ERALDETDRTSVILEAAPPIEVTNVRFTQSEIAVLQDRIPDYFEKMGRVSSPRAVRMLTFKVQLCRYLLEQRGGVRQDPSIDTIIDAMISARNDFEPYEDVAVTVARQII